MKTIHSAEVHAFILNNIEYTMLIGHLTMAMHGWNKKGKQAYAQQIAKLIADMEKGEK